VCERERERGNARERKSVCVRERERERNEWHSEMMCVKSLRTLFFWEEESVRA